MSTTPDGLRNQPTHRRVESPTSHDAAPPSIGSDLQALPKVWSILLTQPRRARFDTEITGASWQRIGVGLALLAVANAVCDYLTGLEAGHASVATAATGLISLMIGFGVFTGIWYMVGRWFGGRGPLLAYAYLISVIIVPIGIITEIIQLIPPVRGLDAAGLFTIAMTLYELYLLILATASALQLPKIKAAAAFLVPFGAIALLVLTPRIAEVFARLWYATR